MLFSQKSYPELISLHIPKTAGTSFRNILKAVYGDEEVVRFDMNENGTFLNEQPYTKSTLPRVRVIHGHFIFKSLRKEFQIPDDCKIITWVRNPVDRVISNYYYLESRLKDILNEEKRNLNILVKMQRTLLEYARAEINRNRQAKFLNGTVPDDFDFIGIHEFFNEEVVRLSRVLQWKTIPEVLYHNKTETDKPEIQEEVIHEILELNKEDTAIYENALQIRKKSLGV